MKLSKWLKELFFGSEERYWDWQVGRELMYKIPDEKRESLVNYLVCQSEENPFEITNELIENDMARVYRLKNNFFATTINYANSDLREMLTSRGRELKYDPKKNVYVVINPSKRVRRILL